MSVCLAALPLAWTMRSMTTVTSTASTEHPLNEALGHTASDKRLEVLRRVGQTGSISQAAREAGISYKAAWQAIETLSSLSGLPLVERSVGGVGGGGARITPQGTRLLALADALALARAQVLARFGMDGEGGDAVASDGHAPATSAAGLGLRTSMRNQLPCRVVQVEVLAAGVKVAVSLQTPSGATLVSSVTRESADLLGLVPGLPVLALCKATAVTVQAAEADQRLEAATDAAGQAAWQGLCVLRGRVSEAVAAGGDGTQEVSLLLPGGGLWTGFAGQGEVFRAGDEAQAVFAPSAVVIGLSG